VTRLDPRAGIEEADLDQLAEGLSRLSGPVLRQLGQELRHLLVDATVARDELPESDDEADHWASLLAPRPRKKVAAETVDFPTASGPQTGQISDGASPVSESIDPRLQTAAPDPQDLLPAASDEAEQRMTGPLLSEAAPEGVQAAPPEVAPPLPIGADPISEEGSVLAGSADAPAASEESPLLLVEGLPPVKETSSPAAVREASEKSGSRRLRASAVRAETVLLIALVLCWIPVPTRDISSVAPGTGDIAVPEIAVRPAPQIEATPVAPPAVPVSTGQAQPPPTADRDPGPARPQGPARGADARTAAKQAPSGSAPDPTPGNTVKAPTSPPRGTSEVTPAAAPAEGTGASGPNSRLAPATSDRATPEAAPVPSPQSGAKAEMKHPIANSGGGEETPTVKGAERAPVSAKPPGPAPNAQARPEGPADSAGASPLWPPTIARAPAPEIASEIDILLQRGDNLLGNGDVVSARLFYERAVAAGSAAAAVGVGRTYDPQFLKGMGVIGIRGDPAKAQLWYQKAKEMGYLEPREPAEAER